ncbi:MAG: hypothetical protein U0667_05020 [Chloroflexota bacterium]
MSRAELATSSAPGLRRGLRDAATDLYFHSMRLVPANLLWGGMLMALVVLASLWLPLVLLLPVLALPTVGIFRIAALVVRGAPVSFRDGLAAWREQLLPALVIGTTLLVVAAVLVVNVATGLTSGGVIGWSLATFAGWGLVAAWSLAWTVWPLLVDPARAHRSVRERLRLGVLLLVAHPWRIGAMAAVLGLLLAVSTIAFAALVMIAVAYAALVATRVVLPAADRLEAALGARA